MTPEQKRVAIAKDVIAGLKSRRLVAGTGVYFNNNAKRSQVTYADVDKGLQLQAKFAKMKRCEVCAIGSIFVAAVERFNDIACSRDVIGSVIDGFRMKDYLLDQAALFDSEQLCDIERAFEGWGEGIPWRNKVRGADTRMTAIMRNIIRNNGEFHIAEVPGAKAKAETEGI